MADFTLDVLQRIEIRVAELGMSKEDFYAKSGISSASFSQWKTGVHEPSTKKLASAAKTLNVTLHYLLTGEEQKEKPVPPDGDGRSAKEIVLEKVDEIAANGDEQALWEIFERLSQRMQKK